MKRQQRTIKRRRFEQRTDYKARLAMLKSVHPRVVVRKTNRYMLIQLVRSQNAQDTVVLSVSSKELLDNGWPANLSGSLKSLAAGYLTGLLAAKKITTTSKHAILDMGMHRNAKKGRIYSVLKGLVDGGVTIAHGPESLPDNTFLEHNTRTREAFIKLKGALGHGRKGN